MRVGSIEPGKTLEVEVGPFRSVPGERLAAGKYTIHVEFRYDNYRCRSNLISVSLTDEQVAKYKRFR